MNALTNLISPSSFSISHPQHECSHHKHLEADLFVPPEDVWVCVVVPACCVGVFARRLVSVIETTSGRMH